MTTNTPSDEHRPFSFKHYTEANLFDQSASSLNCFCSSCGMAVSIIAILRRRERGFDWIVCNVCDERISLPDGVEAFAMPSLPGAFVNQDQDAQQQFDMAELILQGRINVGDKGLHLARLIMTERRRLYELEEQRAYQGISTPPEVKMEIEDLHREIACKEQQVMHIVARR